MLAYSYAMIRPFALALVAACAIGCGGRETLDRPPGAEPLVIRVVNRNWSDMRVYLAHGTSRALLGLVTSGREETFSAPLDMTLPRTELRLVGDPVGSRLVFESEPFLADPGQTVEWTIRVRPDQSGLSVY